MTEIMWLLSLIPDWFYHILLLNSVLAIIATYVINFIPFISQYTIPIRVIGFMVLFLCAWMEGGIVNESKWRKKVQELEAKVAQAEKKAAETNATIETVYVDRVQVVKEIQYKTETRIKELSSELDKTCKISPQAIDILNSSAQVQVKKK